MKNLFNQLFSRPTLPPTVDDLAVQKELQSLRVELEARQQTIDHLKQETERLRSRQAQLVGETAQASLDALFGDLAGPAAQILTQADLLERQGKPVQARDVLSVARRMVRALERHGVSFEGEIGQQVAFDPDRHTPISADSAPQPGQPVTVRFSGVVYKGRIIHKGVVE